MRLVIDIPDEMYMDIKEEVRMKVNTFEHIPFLHEVISVGTPLPKGHEDLMILSKEKLKENQINLDFSCQKWISEVGLSNATVAIIEADTESEKV